MIYLVVTIHVLVSLFLILVVLLQRGQGADLSVFGGGGTQAAFGARSAASLLHKMTVWGFVAFTITTIAYNFLAQNRNNESVLSGLASEAAVEAPAQDPTEALPVEPEVPPADEAEPTTDGPEATGTESEDTPTE